MMGLRRAVTGDAAAIGVLTVAAYGKWVGVIGREPLPMRADPMAALLRHRVDVIDRVGLLAGLIETQLKADHLWVESVAVHPDWQGQGLGRRLIAQAEVLARAAGLGEVRLLTNPAFVGNVAFYQGLGFQIDREEPFRGGWMTYLSKGLTAR